MQFSSFNQVATWRLQIIKTDGMKDNVKAKERKISTDDIAANLAALKKLKKNKGQ